MGVPAFYRWLREKYPAIIQDVHEEDLEHHETREKRPHGTFHDPNPNNIEFDNLYLDMNGIIHPCVHPEDVPAPKTEEQMFINIMKYIDRLVNAVRPKKLLYMAVDGVAPRAKMNQQRSRRFKAAKEFKDQEDVADELRQKLEQQGKNVPEKKESSFDHNVITPGTSFMHRLSQFLRYYAHERLNNDPCWSGLKVIISDASVPGEGEHKIMEYIRLQRTQENYDPNVRHILHGLDADLIMLGLATHEAHFTILREEVFESKKKNAKEPIIRDSDKNTIPMKPLQFLHISILREYLDADFSKLKNNLPFEYDLERIVDDFVFMCFFVGNDFLPHLPSLDIREGAIDLLMSIYKEILPSLGGYLTKDGEINLSRVDIFLGKISVIEDELFRRRQKKQKNDDEFHQRRRMQQAQRENNAQVSNSSAASSAAAPADAQSNRNAAANLKASLKQSKKRQSETEVEQERPTKATRMDVDSNSNDNTVEDESNYSESDEASSAPASPAIVTAEEHEEFQNALKDELKKRSIVEDVQDHVQLGSPGWRDRYYEEKFGDQGKDPEFRRKIACAYTEGLQWVFRYYYSGVACWKWYYPYHYAPFAADLRNIEEFKTNFEEPSTPFTPVQQLMGVLPPYSSHAVPEGCQWLMTDPQSPIIDFYPEDVKLDPNGKKMTWQWVVLLPFIDEERLKKHVGDVEHTFTQEEKERNQLGYDKLLARADHPIGNRLNKLYESSEETISLDPTIEDGKGISGKATRSAFHVSLGSTVPSPDPDNLKHIPNNRVIMAVFHNPPKMRHSCRLLPGARLPPPALDELDKQAGIKIPRLTKGMNVMDLVQSAVAGRMITPQQTGMRGNNRAQNYGGHHLSHHVQGQFQGYAGYAGGYPSGAQYPQQQQPPAAAYPYQHPMAQMYQTGYSGMQMPPGSAPGMQQYPMPGYAPPPRGSFPPYQGNMPPGAYQQPPPPGTYQGQPPPGMLPTSFGPRQQQRGPRGHNYGNR